MKKRIIIIIASIVVVLILAGGGFYLWASTPLPAMPEAISAANPDRLVDVTTKQGWLVFSPKLPIQMMNPTARTTGFIFYPGARVDYRSYAPMARGIATHGYTVVIVPMPLNLAIFGVDQASDVEAVFPTIKFWAIGGHSLGGAMACQYIANHPDKVQGLVLWAAYPGSTDDLSKFNLKVASISGSIDGLATPEKVHASIPLLPVSTTWVYIQGGNHSQFGWYGDQPGDNAAVITRQAQMAIVVQSTVDILKNLAFK